MAKKKVKTKAKAKKKGKSVITPDLQTRLDKMDNIRAELKKVEESASKDIMVLLQDLMKSNPLLTGMRWNQYTPSFNDGDACTFGVNGPDIQFAESVLTKDEYEDNEGWVDEYDVDDILKTKSDILNFEQIAELKKAVDEVQKVFGKLSQMENQLQEMFGDGIQVTVTAEGVETEDYDHD